MVAPAMGGVIIGHEMGRALGLEAVFVERPTGTFELRRGFTIEPGEKVLMVEDVVTTGLSSREARDLADLLKAGALVAPIVLEGEFPLAAGVTQPMVDDDIEAILRATRPEVVYTHNLAIGVFAGVLATDLELVAIGHSTTESVLRPILGMEWRAGDRIVSVNGEAVTALQPVDEDSYGRTVAHVRCGSADVATAQVRAGLAWVYTPYAESRPQLVALQRQARSSGAGLWSQKRPLAPWTYRHRHTR